MRELRNAVERATLQSTGDSEPTPAPPELEPYTTARDRFLAEFERGFLVEALEQSGLNVTEAARRAGVELRHFRRLLQRHDLSASSLRRR